MSPRCTIGAALCTLVAASLGAVSLVVACTNAPAPAPTPSAVAPAPSVEVAPPVLGADTLVGGELAAIDVDGAAGAWRFSFAGTADIEDVPGGFLIAEVVDDEENPVRVVLRAGADRVQPPPVPEGRRRTGPHTSTGTRASIGTVGTRDDERAAVVITHGGRRAAIHFAGYDHETARTHQPIARCDERGCVVLLARDLPFSGCAECSATELVTFLWGQPDARAATRAGAR